tara:strand:+ start:734 stop:859 length:126 start_codon:yes stop_codon:yes gene_type:complete
MILAAYAHVYLSRHKKRGPEGPLGYVLVNKAHMRFLTATLL